MTGTEDAIQQRWRQARVQAELAFRRRVLRIAGCSALTVIFIAFLLWHFVIGPSPSVTVTIPDCAKLWSYTYTGHFFRDESLNVHVHGDIAGHATLHVSQSKVPSGILEPAQSFTLPMA